jgi:predicted metal-dependent HD superfamily phosphohydrolase
MLDERPINMSTDLESSWRAAWRELALPAPAGALFEALCASWSQPQRHYHTLQHLAECLALFDELRALARHRGEVAIALWFHDAVYDVRRHDNEAESAAWARRALLEAGARDEVADRVDALVLATRHSERPATDDERLLVDIDLAILGAAPARFDEYERQIRAEYAWVPDEVFRAKRREILQAFDARRPIYATPALRERLEAAAHANLARSLA